MGKGKWFLLFMVFAAVALTGVAVTRSDASAHGQGAPVLSREVSTGQKGSATLSRNVPVDTPTCVPGWSVVDSPNGSTGLNLLQRVAVVSANDVWAAGKYMGGSSYRTLVEHWDGTQWSVVPSPNVGSFDNEL